MASVGPRTSDRISEPSQGIRSRRKSTGVSRRFSATAAAEGHGNK
jgi:hypothetical protein